LSLLKAFVRSDERNQIDEIINNSPEEPIQLHLRGGRNIEILEYLHFPTEFDGIVHLLGNDGNEIALHFEQEYLLK
ncbi:MAG: hypothetical protein EB127_27715, partial [Alphaproteobacteria bacterium]|nr:hypothetical protein [Alphaproteobacteria bacterium]